MKIDKKQQVKVATYQRPKANHYCNGDSYFYKETDTGFICALADGLGSGQLANESSQAVINAIKENPNATPEQIVEDCNSALFNKRGVVIGILKIDYTTMMYSFLSIGNIGMMTVNQNGERKRFIPKSGFLAGYRTTFKVEHAKVGDKMNFVLFSDGVLEKELIESYILGEDVSRIVSYYQELDLDYRIDDTTLIAVRYDSELT